MKQVKASDIMKAIVTYGSGIWNITNSVSLDKLELHWDGVNYEKRDYITSGSGVLYFSQGFVINDYCYFAYKSGRDNNKGVIRINMEYIPVKSRTLVKKVV